MENKNKKEIYFSEKLSEGNTEVDRKRAPCEVLLRS